MTLERRYILNQIFPSAEAMLFDPGARDNCCEPYIRWKQACTALGYEVEGLREQPLEQCEWLVVWDAWSFEPSLVERVRRLAGRGRREVFEEIERLGSRRPKLALMLFEPPSIVTANADRTIHRKFDVVFTWSPELLAEDPSFYKQIYLPSPTNFPHVRALPFSEKKLLVDVSSWKFSSHPRELYSERRRTIRWFEEHYPDDFDLYGLGWNPRFSDFLRQKIRRPILKWEQYKSYRGPVGNKAELFPKYKFSLVYENIAEPSFISVKIFDCLRSDCIPVYLGAPDIEKHVDAGAFVDRRNFRSNEELGRYLASMTEAEYEGYRDAVRHYLAGDKFPRFLSENFAHLMIEGMALAPATAQPMEAMA